MRPAEIRFAVPEKSRAITPQFQGDAVDPGVTEALQDSFGVAFASHQRGFGLIGEEYVDGRKPAERARVAEP